MKRTVLFGGCMAVLCLSRATTYYSVNSTAPNIAANWHINRNGTGASPANFSGTSDIFVVQTGQTVTTTNNWTVAGTNGKILIETGATLQGDHKVQSNYFEIQGTGKFVHNINNNTFPGVTSTVLASTSTVEIQDWNTSSLPAGVTWGNLVINTAAIGASWNQSGVLTDVAGNLDVKNTGGGTNEFRLATTQGYTLNIGGDLVIEGGILEAGDNVGAYSHSIIIGGSYTQTGGTFTHSNTSFFYPLDLQFDGVSSAFTQSGGTLTSTYIDWTVNTGKKLTLNNNIPLGFLRSFIV
ncbi:MAG TPA: hypothetical protein VGC95_09915, partial [Chitinophagaceae bacterium]